MIDPLRPDYSCTPASNRRPRYAYVPADVSAAPLISIVTPSFNPTALLHEAAISVLNQSLQQWEWLIVNDASTEPESLRLLDEFRHRDPRIRVIDLAQNSGPGAARNAGYREARAELIFQLDDDDLIEPTTLEKMWWFLLTHPEYAIVNGWSIGFGAQEYLWPAGFERSDRLLEENSATGRAMIRRSAHAAAGGFDETIRGGFEDWDFWLRCADRGFCGATIPEYLDWYRRRPTHADRWVDWDSGERQSAFVSGVRARYPRLVAEGFPRVETRWPQPFDAIRAPQTGANRLKKESSRLLLVLPWMALGGADKFNLDAVEQLSRRGWEITIATTVPGGETRWAPHFARFTPDIFILDRFMRPTDVPAFLCHLIESRGIDVTLISNSEAGYLLLPYLHAHAPQSAFVDFCHSESRNWKAGGYPRYAAANHELLERNIVSSEYLKGFVAERGADAARIDVLYTNIDPEHWAPCAATRRSVRAAERIDDDVTLILFAGRLHSDKQPRVLGETFRRLRDRGLPFVGLIVGDGPDEAWLREFSAQYELSPQVRLLGARSSDDVRGLMRAADIFFLPSLWEGIALTMFESMALGLAFVGADVGGQRELLAPGAGILLPKGSEDDEIRAYTQALAQLIRDPGARRAMGAAARRRITEKFSLDAMGARLDGLLRDAIVRREAREVRLPRRFACESATLAVELLRSWALLDQLWARLRDTPVTPAVLSKRHSDAAAEELRRWIRDLENGKRWLERERGNWQETAASQQQMIAELQGWAARLERTITDCKGRPAFRAMRRLGLLPDLNP